MIVMVAAVVTTLVFGGARRRAALHPRAVLRGPRGPGAHRPTRPGRGPHGCGDSGLHLPACACGRRAHRADGLARCSPGDQRGEPPRDSTRREPLLAVVSRRYSAGAGLLRARAALWDRQRRGVNRLLGSADVVIRGDRASKLGLTGWPRPGLAHRQRLIPGVANGSRSRTASLWRVIVVEVVLDGSADGHRDRPSGRPLPFRRSWSRTRHLLASSRGHGLPGAHPGQLVHAVALGPVSGWPWWRSSRWSTCGRP
ncbi:hypothetical protein QJS66_17775 [Kocuria rhizophila]|nr:hypothetical protein QJS66_17775 [Kocuria rhizophila]